MTLFLLIVMCVLLWIPLLWVAAPLLRALGIGPAPETAAEREYRLWLEEEKAAGRVRRGDRWVQLDVKNEGHPKQ